MRGTAMSKLVVVMCGLVAACVLAAPTSGHPAVADGRGNGLLCSACDYAVSKVKWVWQKPVTADCLAKVVELICVDLHIEDNAVCRMVMQQYAEQTIYLLGELLVNPDTVCPLLFDCNGGLKSTNWTVHIPGDKPAYKPWPVPAAGLPTLRVLHLADLHIDTNYTAGAAVNCDEPLCCRSGVKPKKGEAPVPAGVWGSLGACDVPMRTVDNMLEHISKNEKVDMILWTGDLVPHNVWNVTEYTTDRMLAMLVDKFKWYFPGVDVYSAVGNHEGVPVNMFPPRENTVSGDTKRFDIAWLYEQLADDWQEVLPAADIKADVKFNAHYTAKRAGTRLRIISYNAMYCYADNFWTWVIAKDPDDSLRWLVEQLDAAEKAGDKAWIIAHIPNGECMLGAWSRNFYDVVNRYEGTIRGIFTGHTHNDQFEVFYENRDPKEGRPTSLTYIGPSVTTFGSGGANNPAYRIYTVDGVHEHSEYAALNAETYYMDVEEANKSGVPQWRKLYDAKSAYGMRSLNPYDWDAVIRRFETSERAFDLYAQHYHRRRGVACDERCKRSWICAMQSADGNMRNACPTETSEPQIPGWNTQLFAAKADSDLPDICK